MRLALLLLAVLAAFVVWRRRGSDTSRVHVVWRDGGETTVGEGLPVHDRLVAIAGRALA
jgi:hypothetical protein